MGCCGIEWANRRLQLRLVSIQKNIREEENGRQPTPPSFEIGNAQCNNKQGMCEKELSPGYFFTRQRNFYGRRVRAQAMNQNELTPRMEQGYSSLLARRRFYLNPIWCARDAIRFLSLPAAMKLKHPSIGRNDNTSMSTNHIQIPLKEDIPLAVLETHIEILNPVFTPGNLLPSDR
ncbi:MAG: hypothetical protein JWM68_4242 [Verrucomicrobiales bacterium]|nr:hypothetical protein [Verrucomicrobiales bacterium]